MIFDTIYEFFVSIFSSEGDVSAFWTFGFFELGDGTAIGWSDYFSVVGTVIVIICGIFALFRILGGILKLFKV